MPEVQWAVRATETGPDLLAGTSQVVDGRWRPVFTVPAAVAAGTAWVLRHRGVDDAGNVEAWKAVLLRLAAETAAGLPQAMGTLSARPSWAGAFQGMFGAGHDPTTTPGDQPVRTPQRTISLLDVPEWTGNGAADNPTPFGRRWMSYFGNRVGHPGVFQAGDRLLIPAGTHVSAGNLDVPRPAAEAGIEIVAGSATAPAVIQHTQITTSGAQAGLMERHAIRVFGDAASTSTTGISIRAASREHPFVAETIGAVGRTGLNQQGNTMLLIDPYAHDVLVQDVHAVAARAAGYFIYRARRVWLNRCRSTETWADAFHFTNGSEDILLTDCVSERSGDDGVPPVRYGGEGDASSSRRIAVVRHRTIGTGHGRGMVDICNSDIWYDQCYVEGTAAAGLLVDREEGSSGNPKGIAGFLAQRIHAKGCNWGAEDHGTAFFRNPSRHAEVHARVESLLIEDAHPGRNVVRGVGGGGADADGVLAVVCKDFRAVGGPGNSTWFGGNNLSRFTFDPAAQRQETAGADTTPPTLVFMTPGRKATMSGTLTGVPRNQAGQPQLGWTGDYRTGMAIAFYAGHVLGLTAQGVEVRLGDTVLGTVPRSALDSSGRGFLDNVDTTRFVNGPGVLSLSATSSSGKTATTLYRPVTVQNTTPGSLAIVPAGYAGQSRVVTGAGTTAPSTGSGTAPGGSGTQAPPTGFSASRTSAAPTQASLTWTKAAGATHYLLYRAVQGQGVELLATLGDVAAYTDPTLAAGNGYFYELRARASDGTTLSSAVSTNANRP